GASERANYQLFLSEFCTLLGVPLPNPSVADDQENGYVFEKRVGLGNKVEAASSRFSPDKGKRQDAASTLTAKEKTIHEQGLVSILKQLHDDLDAAVAEAYGWPDLSG